MKKKLHKRRLLILGAIILMIGSFFTGHETTSILIFAALALLAVTLLFSIFSGSLSCGGGWFEFWAYDEELFNNRK